MRIMLDTNVLVSAALFPSVGMTEFLTCDTRNNRVVLCSYILDELSDVVGRKFPDKQEQIESFLQKLPSGIVLICVDLFYRRFHGSFYIRRERI